MSEKEAYQQKMEAEIKEWGAKIDQLEAKTEKASAEAKIQYKEQLSVLTKKKDAAKAKLNELKNASEGAWESAKSGLDNAWTDLKASLENAVSRFK